MKKGSVILHIIIIFTVVYMILSVCLHILANRADAEIARADNESLYYLAKGGAEKIADVMNWAIDENDLKIKSVFADAVKNTVINDAAIYQYDGDPYSGKFVVGPSYAFFNQELRKAINANSDLPDPYKTGFSYSVSPSDGKTFTVAASYKRLFTISYSSVALNPETGANVEVAGEISRITLDYSYEIAEKYIAGSFTYPYGAAFNSVNYKLDENGERQINPLLEENFNYAEALDFSVPFAENELVGLPVIINLTDSPIYFYESAQETRALVFSQGDIVINGDVNFRGILLSAGDLDLQNGTLSFVKDNGVLFDFETEIATKRKILDFFKITNFGEALNGANAQSVILQNINLGITEIFFESKPYYYIKTLSLLKSR